MAWPAMPADASGQLAEGGQALAQAAAHAVGPGADRTPGEVAPVAPLAAHAHPHRASCMGLGLALLGLATARRREAQAFCHPFRRLIAPALAQSGNAGQVGRAQAGEEQLEVAIGGHGGFCGGAQR